MFTGSHLPKTAHLRSPAHGDGNNVVMVHTLLNRGSNEANMLHDHPGRKRQLSSIKGTHMLDNVSYTD